MGSAHVWGQWVLQEEAKTLTSFLPSRLDLLCKHGDRHAGASLANLDDGDHVFPEVAAG